MSRQANDRIRCVAAALMAGATAVVTTGLVQAADEKSAGEATKTMPVPPAPASPSPVTMARGRVEKVDKGSGSITIKHGPVMNLHMPATTTVFRVQDEALFNRVKEGDTINFSVEKANGILTVRRLELAR